MWLFVCLFFLTKIFFYNCFEILIESSIISKLNGINDKSSNLTNEQKIRTVLDKERLEYLDLFFKEELDKLKIEFLFWEKDIMITYNFVNYNSRLCDTVAMFITLLKHLSKFDQYYVSKLIEQFENFKNYVCKNKVLVSILDHKIKRTEIQVINTINSEPFENKFVIFFFCLQKIHRSIIRNKKRLFNKTYYLQLNKYIQKKDFKIWLNRDLDLEYYQTQ